MQLFTLYPLVENGLVQKCWLPASRSCLRSSALLSALTLACITVCSRIRWVLIELCRWVYRNVRWCCSCAMHHVGPNFMHEEGWFWTSMREEAVTLILPDIVFLPNALVNSLKNIWNLNPEASSHSENSLIYLILVLNDPGFSRSGTVSMSIKFFEKENWDLDTPEFLV